MKTTKAVTPEQAADALRVHLATVYRLIEAGQLTATGEGYGAQITAESVNSCRVKVCGHCGKEFTATHGRQAYCSDSCRFKAGHARQKQRAQKKPKSPATADRHKVKVFNPGKRLEAVLKRIAQRQSGV